ncbi:hypothetical protein ALC57_13597 [Trachymyrmex cornetzi]|uniref:Uncharacterized protein n=1 Tax=Trachymyrmex cornetzi TaxID=471704 RepID=A0A151IZA8_9HYME|nr:hypothetical protein ALC57_13597 [Trachymyrmex cornetzi]
MTVHCERHFSHCWSCPCGYGKETEREKEEKDGEAMMLCGTRHTDDDDDDGDDLCTYVGDKHPPLPPPCIPYTLMNMGYSRLYRDHQATYTRVCVYVIINLDRTSLACYTDEKDADRTGEPQEPAIAGPPEGRCRQMAGRCLQSCPDCRSGRRLYDLVGVSITDQDPWKQ